MDTINVKVRYADNEIDMDLPMSANAIYAKLAEIHADPKKGIVFVSEVKNPPQIDFIECGFVNIYELNTYAEMLAMTYRDIWSRFCLMPISGMEIECRKTHQI